MSFKDQPFSTRYSSMGDEATTFKKCTKCGHRLQLADFYRRKASIDGLQPVCKPCDNAYKKARPYEKQRDLKLRGNFGITLDEYNALLAEQGGACSACGSTTAGGRGMFHVDYDHDCCPGKACGQCVRGLLCHWCNTALGLVKDYPNHLRQLITYLERNP